MQKHMMDYMNSVHTQTFSAAAVVDSRGNHVGNVVIRFTDAQIGYNHSIAVLMFGDPASDLDLGTVKKGSTYDQPQTLVSLLSKDGYQCLDYYGNHVDENQAKTLGNFSDIHGIKRGNKMFRIYWVM